MGEMAVMGKEGDTKLIWNPRDEAEVENARATFNKLRNEKKFAAFKVNPNDGSKGELIREFDPSLEKIIFAPPLVGG